MVRLTWPQAIAWHVKRQHLDTRAPRSQLLRLTSELCGLHAQVMSSAELTAWCRIDGLRRDDISHALWRDRKLVKTWAMRSTLHLLPSAEYGLWVRVFSLYEARRTQRWFDYFGINEEDLERLIAAAGEALSGKMLTRDELADEIARRTGLHGLREKLLQGWGSLLKPACYRGLLCFAPGRGRNVQFTRIDTDLSISATDAQMELTRRYFATYGPATTKDFQRWLQAPHAKVRELIAFASEELIAVDIEGVSAYMLRAHAKKAAQMEPVSTVRLLPAFDQYVFAAGLRSARLMRGDFHARIYRSQGWFSPVLMVDGRMDGTWRFDRNGSQTVKVTMEPFLKLPLRVKRAAEEEAERLAVFMDRRLEVKWVR